MANAMVSSAVLLDYLRSVPLVGWLFVGFVILLSRVVFLAIYRLFFHPLSKYPGPIWAKLSNAYAGYHAYKGDLHIDVCRCHETYGKVVRYGPNRLIINSGKAMQDVYGFGRPVRKADAYATMIPWRDGWSSATAIDAKLHKGMRSTVSSGLSVASYKQFEPAVTRNMDTWCQLLHEDHAEPDGYSEPKDMTHWSKWLFLDVLAELSFGKKVGFLEQPELRPMTDVLDMHTAKVSFYEQWPSVDKMGLADAFSRGLKLLSPSVKRFDKWHSDFTDEIFRINSESASGILAPLIRAALGSKGQPQTHTKDQAVAEGSFIVLSGADLMAATAAASLFYLLHFPEVKKKVEQEVRMAFDSADAVCTGPKLSACSYLRAFLQETMRVTPAGANMPWREVEQAALFDDVFIPAGCEVGVGLYPLRRNPDVFRDAMKFWPERWLPSTLPQKELDTAMRSWKPFLLGPRSCTGQYLAMTLLTLMLARLVRTFDMRLPDGTLGRVGEGSAGAAPGRQVVDEFQIDARFIAMTKGPYVQFRKWEADGTSA